LTSVLSLGYSHTVEEFNMFGVKKMVEFDEGTGPDRETVGYGVLIWAIMQGDRMVSVNEAALAFNTTPDVIKSALSTHSETYIIRRTGSDYIMPEGLFDS
jgi:hypothetical protein